MPPSVSTQPPTRSVLALLAAAVGLGALLRLPTLDVQSFWFDEALTYNVVSDSFEHVLRSVILSETTTVEMNPPLYFATVWVWSQVVGVGEVGLRSFSALCGILTIPVAWAIGRRAISERVGLVAALLTAVNPLLIWYSQEARAYSMLVLLSALSLLTLLRVLALPSGGRTALWGLTCTIALSTHYFAAIVIVPETLWLLVALHARGELTRSKVVIGLGPVVATAVALVPLALHQRQSGGTQEESLATRIAGVVLNNVIGNSPPLPGVPALSLTLVMSGLAAVSIGFALLRRATPGERAALRIPLSIGCFGLVGALLATPVADYFYTRNLLPTWPMFAIALAAGFGASRAGRLGMRALGALALLSVVCVVSEASDPESRRADWRGAARALGAASDVRAIVSYERAGEALKPYVGELERYPVSGAAIREVDVIALHGSWVGSDHRLQRGVRLSGFEVVDRFETDSYTLVRYRSPVAMHKAASTLRALYPGLADSSVVLQRPTRSAG